MKVTFLTKCTAALNPRSPPVVEEREALGVASLCGTTQDSQREEGAREGEGGEVAPFTRTFTCPFTLSKCPLSKPSSFWRSLASTRSA